MKKEKLKKEKIEVQNQTTEENNENVVKKKEQLMELVYGEF